MTSPVPLVGDPFELCEWHSTHVLKCKRCDAGAIVVTVGVDIGVCPACGSRFQFVGFTIAGKLVPMDVIGLSIIVAPPATAAKVES